MRQLQLALSAGDVGEAVDVVDEHGFGHAVTGARGPNGGEALLHVLTPADAVEPLLGELEEAGLDPDGYLVSLDTEFARFEGIDEVQNHWGGTPNRLAPAALRSKAKDLRRNTRSFLWMMGLSAIVATAGLLLHSPAVVVGSMVIAPIVSPVLTASVGTVRNDRDMLIESLHMQGQGLAVAIATAGLVAWATRSMHVVPAELAIEQVRLVSLRLSPSMLAITIGLAAGAAGAFGLATKGQVTIVGVMIAAALIPTAAAVGVGLAWGNLVVALGALLLLVLSMAGVNLGGTAMLAYLDYRPDEVDEPIVSFDDARQAVTVTATLGATLLAVVAVGVLFVEQSTFERSVNRAVGDVLDHPDRGALGVERTTIEYRTPLAGQTPTVTVQLARTDGGAHAELADELAEAIADRTGHEVEVQVTFVDYQRASPERA